MNSRSELYKLAIRGIRTLTVPVRIGHKFTSPNTTTRPRPVFHLKNPISASILYRSRDFRSYVTTAEENRVKASEENAESMTIFQIFSVLKMKKDRLGPLNIADIKNGLEKLELLSVQLSEEEFLQLLQLTMKAVEEEYRNCSSIVQQVWSLHTKLEDEQLSLHHLEVYFKMCLLADIPISYETMWNFVGDRNVSRELLEVMMLILGRHGSLQGTANMLTYMKQQEIPITETIFSALILAHGFCRDADKINDIVDTMRNIQMDSTNVTYHALMTAYAVSGQFHKVEKIVEQMEKIDVNCTPSQLMSLLLDLVKNKEAGMNFRNMEFILKLIEEKDVVLDFSTIALHLIHHGHVAEAFKILSTHPPIQLNKEFYSNGWSYIQEMIHSTKDTDLIVTTCQKLEQDEINKYALLVALEIAHLTNRNDLSWALLRALKETDKPLRQHYFWPLLSKPESPTSSKLMEYVQNMISLGVTPELETMKDFIFPKLPLENPILTERMLKESGMKVSQVATPLLIELIRNNMIDQAINYVSNLKVDISLQDMTAPLARAWITSPQSAIYLLALLIEKSGKDALKVDWGGQFLLDIAASRSGFSKHQISPLIQELKKNNVRISETSADYLLAKASESIRKELKNSLHLIIDDHLGQPPKELDYNFLPHPSNMNIEELEGHLVELQSKGFKTRGVIRKLILMHASEDNFERVGSLLKEFELTGEKISPGVLASILDTYVSIKNVEAARNIFHTLRREYSSFVLDGYKVIDLSKILIENGRNQEAISILEDTLALEGNRNEIQSQVRRNCRELLMAAAATGDYNTTKQIMQLLQKRNIIKMDKVMLGPLIKCLLNNDDYIGAVEELKSIYKNYNLIPMKIEVLINLLHKIQQTSKGSSHQSSKEYSELLEEVLNVIARAQGLKNTHHDLLFACVEAGYSSRAEQVLKNLGNKIDRMFVKRQCLRYAKTVREDPLLHLLAASKGISSINREDIYSALLSIYCIQNNGNKGLSLWIQMQEEDIVPSEEFRKNLGSLLTSNDIQNPFDVSQAI